jgi:hypothetical protein
VYGRAHVVAGLLRDRGVRRLELAFAGFNVAEHGAWVAVLVYAYEQGGATAAALIAVCQLLPSSLAVGGSSRAQAAGRRVLCGGASTSRRGQPSALVPALVALAGPAEALIVTGLLLSAITLATASGVQRVGAHAFAPALVQPGAG